MLTANPYEKWGKLCNVGDKFPISANLNDFTRFMSKKMAQ